ncbi:hypothetical protein D5018_09305 [Parashewanella curva]|uniref:Uncharacterized protein n=1 Tax=Parashewanella curva TaxID=2338552 RepID=A0A3L8PXE0_9GAMM|nr:hypothetical protein [Parashewanella curva]RLV59991.1 hypothetical protein D5018_09305 [Parashewanella curva]
MLTKKSLLFILLLSHTFSVYSAPTPSMSNQLTAQITQGLISQLRKDLTLSPIYNPLKTYIFKDLKGIDWKSSLHDWKTPDGQVCQSSPSVTQACSELEFSKDTLKQRLNITNDTDFKLLLNTRFSQSVDEEIKGVPVWRIAYVQVNDGSVDLYGDSNTSNQFWFPAGIEFLPPLVN